MKNFTKIFILVGGLVLSAPALAQHKVSGLPDGWQVEVDGTAVTIKDMEKLLLLLLEKL